MKLKVAPTRKTLYLKPVMAELGPLLGFRLNQS